jgi:hypothetical protein
MTRSLRAPIACLAAALWAGTAPVHAAPARTWPRIRPITVERTIDFERGFTLDLPLRDSNGRTRYLLACRAGRPGYMDVAPSGDDGNWTGDLMCTLNAGRTSTNDLSLLSDDDESAWHSRGVFDLRELTGACAAYPEFGRDRAFRMRGMRISLHVHDVVLARADRLRSAGLRIDVVPDANATDEQAAQPGYRDPGREGCGTIRRGNDVRMCRGAAGGWTACPEQPATGVRR